MLEMFDELDSVGGRLVVQGIGSLDVSWTDTSLTIEGVTSLRDLELVMRYIKLGPKMENVIEKLHRTLAASERQPVSKPERDTPTPDAQAVVDAMSGTTSDNLDEPNGENSVDTPELSGVGGGPCPDSTEERRARGEPTTSVFPVTAEASRLSKTSGAECGVDDELPQLEVDGRPGLNPDAVRTAFDSGESVDDLKKAKVEDAAYTTKDPKRPKRPKGPKKPSKKKSKKTSEDDDDMADVMKVMADTFKLASPESKQDVPELTSEQKEKLYAAADKVTAAAGDFEAARWQVPLVGEEYDGEGVNTVEMWDDKVSLTLASGTTVTVDFEGNELSRVERDVSIGDGGTSKPLPQELATTRKISELIQHLVIDQGFDKSQTLEALHELKAQGHPALVNVSDVEKRAGALL